MPDAPSGVCSRRCGPQGLGPAGFLRTSEAARPDETGRGTLRSTLSRDSPRSLLAARADAWALMVLIGLVLAFCAPLFAHPGRMRDPENGDSLNYYLHLELARRSIVGYGQFPWWTPYVRGGLPLVGHPRDVSVSPVVLPALVLLPIEAVKVICVLIYLAGALGMYYLTRGVLGLARVASVAASVLLVTSAWLPARLVGGNYDEWHLVLFPLVLGFFLRSRQHWRYLIYAAAVLYVTIIDGKTIIAVFGLYLLLVAAEEVGQSISRGQPCPLPLVRLVGLFVLAGALATVKIVPLVQVMGAAEAHEAPPIVRPAVPWDAASLGLRTIDDGDENFGTRAEDLGTGYAAVALFLLGCAAARRRMVGWLLLLLVSVLLMLSRLVPPWMDLFALLNRLPVLSALRKPFKYFNFFVLFILCLGAGHGLAWLGGQRRWGRWAAVCAAVAAVGVPYAWHIRLQGRIFSAPAQGPQVRRDGDFYSLVALDPAERHQGFRMFKDYFFVREGVGVLNWYDPMPLVCHAVPRYVYTPAGQGDGFTLAGHADYRGEAWLESGGHAVIRQADWGPLGITVDVEFSGDDVLVINQNYNRRWRASVGEVVDRGGRLAVALPAGASQVRLSYRPTDHYLAALVSLLAGAGCAAALVIDARRRRPAPVAGTPGGR